MSTPLPCGRPKDWLVDLAAGETPDPADAEHLHSCRYCRAELAAMQRRWNAVRDAASRPVGIPTGLVERTLSTVRAVRGGLLGRHAEAAQPGGVVRIGESALVVLAHRLAIEVVDDLAGVRFRGLSGGLDGLQIRLAVRYGLVLADVAARVRRDLARALDHAVGTAAPPLDVLVEDVLVPVQQR